MMKNRKRLFLGIIFVVILVLVEIIIFRNQMEKVNKKYNISIVVYDEGKNWDNLLAGANLATEGRNAEINMVKMSEDAGAEEQKELISRAIANGADGVLVAACDSYGFGDYFEDKEVNSKVTFIGNGTEDNISCISADNYKMGKEIAKIIMGNESSDASIALVCFDRNKKNVELRKNGVIDAIHEIDENREVIVWENGEELASQPADVVVLLYDEDIENIASAVSASNSKAKMYAIGNSDRAVYLLDSKKLEYLVYPDEFGMGYLGVKCILNDSNYDPNRSENYIKYKVVMRDDLYSGENEKMLFPFVK